LLLGFPRFSSRMLKRKPRSLFAEIHKRREREREREGGAERGVEEEEVWK